MPAWLPWVLGSIILFGIGGFAGKMATEKITALQLYLFEGIGTLTIFFIVVLFFSSRIFPNLQFNNWGIIMGITWGIGTVLFIKALSLGEASIVSSYVILYPLIVVILSMLVLKERPSSTEAVGIILAIVAGFLLTRG